MEFTAPCQFLLRIIKLQDLESKLFLRLPSNLVFKHLTVFFFLTFLGSFIDIDPCFCFSNKINRYLVRAYDVPSPDFIFGGGGIGRWAGVLTEGVCLCV